MTLTKRFFITISLLLFSKLSFAICERLDQANNPFCQQKEEFDQESTDRQAIKNQSKSLDDVFYLMNSQVTGLTGNVLDNDWACDQNPCDLAISATGLSHAILDSSAVGRYGILNFDSRGSFAYVLDKSNPAVADLQPGQQITDLFIYIMVEPWYDFNYPARLEVNIIGDSVAGNQNSSVVARPDEYSLIKDFFTIDNSGNTTSNSFSGNVLDNDLGAVTATLSGRIKPLLDEQGNEISDKVLSYYGIMQFDSEGNFTYTLLNDSEQVRAIPDGEFREEIFQYTVTGEGGISNQSTIKFTIIGNSSQDNQTGSVVARPDEHTLVRDSSKLIITGNVMNNDVGGISASLVRRVEPTKTFTGEDIPPNTFGYYGNLEFDSEGNFTYTMFNDSAQVKVISSGEFKEEIFEYTITGEGGISKTAELKFRILGGLSVLKDNAEIENNDVSAKATPLASAHIMRGHLHTGDKDWYVLEPPIEDRILHLELCPQNTSCYNQKSWVLYVFDGSKLTLEQEFATQTLLLTHNAIAPGDPGNILNSSTINNMYLNYRSGVFTNGEDSSLIGVIDPCFGSLNSVDIGVKEGKEDYYIAISSPLKGDDDTNTSPDGEISCGGGSVVLTKPGPPIFIGTTDVGSTQEYISIFPANDDQYTFTVSVLDESPKAPVPEENVAKIGKIAENFNLSEYDSSTGIASLPRVRVNENLYAVELKLLSNSESFNLTLTKLDLLNEQLDGYPLQAIYDPATEQLHIPYLQEITTGNLYDVWLRFIPATETTEDYLLLLKATPITL